MIITEMHFDDGQLIHIEKHEIYMSLNDWLLVNESHEFELDTLDGYVEYSRTGIAGEFIVFTNKQNINLTIQPFNKLKLIF